MARTGILGGTFDPIHLGHLITAQYACNALRLDRVLLIPSASPVHRPRHAPAAAEHRLRMCRLAAASLASFEVSDVEVTRADPSYTVLTLRYLAQTMGPGEELFLLAGADNLPLLHTWRHFEEIMHLARVAILPRGGDGAEADLTALRCAIGDRATEEILGRRVVCPLVPVSATEVRERLRAGQDVGGLLPSSVAAYIRAVSLYLP